MRSMNILTFLLFTFVCECYSQERNFVRRKRQKFDFGGINLRISGTNDASGKEVVLFERKEKDEGQTNAKNPKTEPAVKAAKKPKTVAQKPDKSSDEPKPKEKRPVSLFQQIKTPCESLQKKCVIKTQGDRGSENALALAESQCRGVKKNCGKKVVACIRSTRGKESRVKLSQDCVDKI